MRVKNVVTRTGEEAQFAPLRDSEDFGKIFYDPRNQAVE